MKTRINPYKEIAFSVEEVAQKLSLTVEGVDKLVDDGLLPTVFFDQSERILAADLAEYVQSLRC
ncbi:MAG: hypothetical protein WAR37_03940 [Candidatus Microsaccharimonas sp.]